MAAPFSDIHRLTLKEVLMHSRKVRLAAIAALLAALYGLGFPVYRVYAMGSADVNVDLPVGEIEGLIQELQDAANQVVGEAGIQIRETVRELSEQMRQRIDQLKEAATAIIKETVTQIRNLIRELITQARALLGEIRTMIRETIQCINQALAERIAQIKDSIIDILEQVGKTVKEAVDHIYVRSTQLIDTGSNRVATVIDSTLNLVAKIVLLVLAFVLLFWLLRSLWKGSFPKAPALRFGIPGFVVLLIAGCGWLIASPSALGNLLGANIPIPRWENACENGNRLAAEFLSMKNGGAPPQALKAVGDSALDQLNWCLYASMSPEVGRGTETTIAEITAVLYPPPPPPPATTPTTASPCGPQNPISIHPGWVGKYDLLKVSVLSTMRSKNLLRATVFNTVGDTAAYFRNIRTVTGLDTRAIRSRPKTGMLIDRAPR
jgi:gas vesicle protein